VSDASLSSEQAPRERYDSCGSEGGNREGRGTGDRSETIPETPEDNGLPGIGFSDRRIHEEKQQSRRRTQQQLQRPPSGPGRATLKILLPLTSMAHQIQEMGRVQGLSRYNSPAAMGKLYEILTGVNLDAATLEEEREFPTAGEPKVYYLGD
jgi:hypothetical protein